MISLSYLDINPTIFKEKYKSIDTPSHSMIIYLDGKYLPEGLAKVSVFDHGLLYGDGVFEGIRAYNGRVFRLKEHIDRMYDSAKTLDITPPISKEEMIVAICEVLRRNRAHRCLHTADHHPRCGRPWARSPQVPESVGYRYRRDLGRYVRRPVPRRDSRPSRSRCGATRLNACHRM